MKLRTHLEPAAGIIRKLGGITRVSRIVGAHPNTVSRWRYAKHENGTNGCIPYKHVEILLADARSRGIELEPAEFFPRSN